MKNVRFIFKDANGQLNVVWPMTEFVARSRNQNLDDAAIKQVIIEKDVLPYCPSGIYREVNFDDLPKDRYFRNAWDHTEKGDFQIDRTKAEKIHMDNLRIDRDTKLKALDVDFMKAIEQRDTDKQTEVAALKQTLRDMPDTEDLSKLSIDELKEYKPSYLKD